jgi:TetR/AcrR family fatty acid metabolism transcriptional regulator
MHTMDKIRAIVTTAQRMFSQHGYENTTVNDIAKEAGVAGGTIIYHFKNKENLLFIVAWHVLNLLYKKTAAALPVGATGLDTATAFAAAFFTFLREHRADYRTLLRNTVFDTLDTRAFPNADLKIIQERYVMLLEECIGKGLRDGSVEDCAPRDVATAINAMLNGAARLNMSFGHSLDVLESETITFLRARLQTPVMEKPCVHPSSQPIMR